MAIVVMNPHSTMLSFNSAVFGNWTRYYVLDALSHTCKIVSGVLVCDMRVKDLSGERVWVGLRIRSLVNPYKCGTIVRVDPKDDDFAWIQWDGDVEPFSGFYGTDCECEIVEEQ
jgi:hypothetical protein